MSPAQFNDHHAKRETILYSQSQLKINRDSHFIKKSSSPSSSSSSSSSSLVNGVANLTNKPQQRHPVIIYTHSPKIIRTHPKDFMALVQKLTGLSRSDDQDNQNTTTPLQPKLDPKNDDFIDDHNNDIKGVMVNDDNESTSVVTDENNGNGGTTLIDTQVNSCFVHPTQIFDPPNPCFNGISYFNPSSTDILCTTQPFYNYSDSLYFMPNMISSLSSSTLEGMKELPEF